jgi:hypothetical protein
MNVIAEIVSLSGYESQVSALLNEEERMAEPERVFMASIYAKSRKETLSAADRNVLTKLAAQIKKAARGGR